MSAVRPNASLSIPPVERVPARFVFGGVAFECSASFPFLLDEEHGELAGAFEDGPVVAAVHCAIERSSSGRRFPDRPRHIAARRLGPDTLEVESATSHTLLRRLDHGRYVAMARVAEHRSASGALLTSVSGALVEAEGGLVLHATAVELEGAAHVFIGPSGAGKTTAARLVAGAQWFARDRAAVFPLGGRWWVARHAGGSPVGLAPSSATVLPLAGIYRVVHGRVRPSLEEPSAPRAMALLRESVQGGITGHEEARLDTISDLVGDGRVHVLRTVLGRGLRDALLPVH
jgi:hypothetical protein